MRYLVAVVCSFFVSCYLVSAIASAAPATPLSFTYHAQHAGQFTAGDSIDYDCPNVAGAGDANGDQVCTLCVDLNCAQEILDIEPSSETGDLSGTYTVTADDVMVMEGYTPSDLYGLDDVLSALGNEAVISAPVTPYSFPTVFAEEVVAIGIPVIDAAGNDLTGGTSPWPSELSYGGGGGGGGGGSDSHLSSGMGSLTSFFSSNVGVVIVALVGVAALVWLLRWFFRGAAVQNPSRSGIPRGGVGVSTRPKGR